MQSYFSFRYPVTLQKTVELGRASSYQVSSEVALECYYCNRIVQKSFKESVERCKEVVYLLSVVIKGDHEHYGYHGN